MALKKRIKSIEGLEEGIKALYKNDGDEYVLDLESSDDDPNPNADAEKSLRESLARQKKLEEALKASQAEAKKAKERLEGSSKTTEAQLAELRKQVEEQAAQVKAAKVDSAFAEAVKVIAPKIKPHFTGLFEDTELRKNWEVNEEGKLVHKEGTFKNPEEHLSDWIKRVPEAAPTSKGGGVQETQDDAGATLDSFRDDKGNLNYGALEEATADGKNPHLLEALSEEI